MKLNRGSKKVLNVIIRSKPTMQNDGYDIYKLEKPRNMSDRELIETLIYLDSIDAIRFSRPGNPGSFFLTVKGKHYFEFQWLAVRDFLLKSILVPILVSILTTLTLLWLGVS